MVRKEQKRNHLLTSECIMTNQRSRKKGVLDIVDDAAVSAKKLLRL